MPGTLEKIPLMRSLYQSDKAGRAIGLFSAPIGNGNLGDEATIAAVIQSIKRRHPAASICAFSSNPADTCKRHQVPSFPIRRINQRAFPEGHEEQHGGAKKSKTIVWRIRNRLEKVRVVYIPLKALRDYLRLALQAVQEIKSLPGCFKDLRKVHLLVVTGSGILSDHFGGPWNFPYTFFKWSLPAKDIHVQTVSEIRI